MINGITHISMKCRGEDGLKKVLAFYVDLLGMKVVRKWNEGLMIETGNCQIEIFTNLKGNPETGIIRHIALDVDDSAFYAEKCKAAGYEVFQPPKQIELGGQKAIISFCYGPLGEQVEFYQKL